MNLRVKSLMIASFLLASSSNYAQAGIVTIEDAFVFNEVFTPYGYQLEQRSAPINSSNSFTVDALTLSSDLSYSFQQVNNTISMTTTLYAHRFADPSDYGPQNAQASTYFIFIAGDNTDYAFTGSLLLDRYHAGGQLDALFVNLFDNTNNSAVFQAYGWAGYDSDGNIFLDGNNSQASGGLQGSPDGRLIAGHQYFMEVGFDSESYGDNFGEWVIHGSVNFTLTDSQIAATPEPASITIFGLGAIGLGIAARRRRKKAEVA